MTLDRRCRTGRRRPRVLDRVKPSLAILASLLAVAAACDNVESPTAPAADVADADDAADVDEHWGRFGHGIFGRGRTGAVFTMTNAASNNEILVFRRHADGTIGAPTAVPTGGDGSGGGLGSQGAVVLSENGRWLLAVNAGSNELSVFRVYRGGIYLADRVPSGGEMPVSVTIHGNLVYVVNAGAPNNVTGFWLTYRGRLWEIAGSSRPLSAPMTAPAQVSFTNSGRTLVVTEKATNLITTFPVQRRSGRLGSARSIASEGETPFGFAFDRHGRLFVSEAFGGAPGASTLSSYRRGSFTPISSSVPSGETAACWVVISKLGRFAFITNTGSGSVSSYEIRHDGSVTLRHAVAASTGEGSTPIDMALNRNGRFLFVLAPGNGTMRPYAINKDGTLTGLGPIDGVPATASGVAAY